METEGKRSGEEGGGGSEPSGRRSEKRERGASGMDENKRESCAGISAKIGNLGISACEA